MRFTASNVLFALAVGALGAAIICGLLAFAAHAAPSAPTKPASAAMTADVAGRDVAVASYEILFTVHCEPEKPVTLAYTVRTRS